MGQRAASSCRCGSDASSRGVLCAATPVWCSSPGARGLGVRVGVFARMGRMHREACSPSVCSQEQLARRVLAGCVGRSIPARLSRPSSSSVVGRGARAPAASRGRRRRSCGAGTAACSRAMGVDADALRGNVHGAQAQRPCPERRLGSVDIYARASRRLHAAWRVSPMGAVVAPSSRTLREICAAGVGACLAGPSASASH